MYIEVEPGVVLSNCMIDVLTNDPKTESPNDKLVGELKLKDTAPKSCLGIPTKAPDWAELISKSPILNVFAVLMLPVSTVGVPKSAKP
jgi:hypothetical protein